MVKQDPIDVEFQVVAEKQLHQPASDSIEVVGNLMLVVAMWAFAGFCLHKILIQLPI